MLPWRRWSFLAVVPLGFVLPTRGDDVCGGKEDGGNPERCGIGTHMDVTKLRRDILDTLYAEDIVDKFLNMTPEDAHSEKRLFQARQACKSIVSALVSLQHPTPDELSQRVKHFCAYHAGGAGGLWGHHQQWPSVYHSQLRATPVYQRPLTYWPELEEALLLLESGMKDVGNEYRLLPSKHAKVLDPQLILGGNWTGVYLLGDQQGRNRTCDSHNFPKSCDLLQTFMKTLPRCRGGCLNLPTPHLEAYHLQAASLNKLAPDSKLVLHTGTDNQRIKVHCGVSNRDGVALEIANETIIWKRGACIVIDDSFEHKVVSHRGQNERIILELKLTHPDFERSSFVIDTFNKGKHRKTFKHAPMMYDIRRR